ERATEPRPEPDGEIDGGFLPPHLTIPFHRVRVRKVWREAQHRTALARPRHRLDHRIDISSREAAEETVVVFESVAAERRRGFDPRHVAHLTADELIEITLGKNADGR